MGKTVTLEDYSDIECGNSVSNKQQTKMEEKEKEIR